MTQVNSAIAGSEAGSAFQMLLSATLLGFNVVVPNAGSLVSPVIASAGFQKVAVALTSSQAGQLSIQRYLDPAGTIPQGAPISTAVVAATAAVVNATDGVPFASFKVTITNTGGVAANLTLVGGLLQSA